MTSMTEGRPLTTAEAAKLKALHAQGLTDARIAQFMEVERPFLTGERARLGLAANAEAQVIAAKEQPAPRDRPNPIQVAENWLGRRLVRTDDVLLLDGIPRNSQFVVREANRLLIEAGFEQVGPPHWRV